MRTFVSAEIAKKIINDDMVREYDCGCLICKDLAETHFFCACPMHNAAPDLLAALQTVVKAAGDQDENDGWVWVYLNPAEWTQIKQALARCGPGTEQEAKE